MTNRKLATPTTIPRTWWLLLGKVFKPKMVLSNAERKIGNIVTSAALIGQTA